MNTKYNVPQLSELVIETNNFNYPICSKCRKISIPSCISDKKLKNLISCVRRILLKISMTNFKVVLAIMKHLKTKFSIFSNFMLVKSKSQSESCLLIKFTAKTNNHLKKQEYS